MEFSIEKGALLIIISGKWRLTEEIELPNKEKNLPVKNKTCKYLGILEADNIKHEKT